MSISQTSTWSVPIPTYDWSDFLDTDDFWVDFATPFRRALYRAIDQGRFQSQADFANKSEISISAVSRYLSQKKDVGRMPPLDIAIALARSLNVPLDDLYDIHEG